LVKNATEFFDEIRLGMFSTQRNRDIEKVYSVQDAVIMLAKSRGFIRGFPQTGAALANHDGFVVKAVLN
jgi:hypothetical protein